MVELLYFASGLILPAFYVPQIVRLLRDDTGLAGYSIGKSASQFALRWPALLFSILVVKNDLMTLVVALDALGRTIELGSAIWSLRRQKRSVVAIAKGWAMELWGFRPSRLGWRRYMAILAATSLFATLVSHALVTQSNREQSPNLRAPLATEPATTTGGYLDGL